MSDEVLGTVDLPLDSDGFLRRECPHCQRQFKWLPGDTDSEVEPGGYHCPYCDGRADEDAWWTHAQLRVVEAAAVHVVEGRLHDMFKNMERKSTKHLKIKAGSAPRKPSPSSSSEPDDMQRVDFVCHPKEPLKIDDNWSGCVHCLVCGRPTTETRNASLNG